ncbi:MAG: hypothetical protein AAB492_01640 [Patescibacteria group bacterium]
MSVFIRHVTNRTTSVISLVALIIFLPLFLLAIKETITLVSRASGTSANIIVDTKAQLEPIKTDFYHAFAQGGEESNDMIASIIGDVKALKPKYIRIDHLYDYYNVVGKNGDSLTFDWSRLDAYINSLTATGAKPVLALSYMPSVIAKDGGIINAPNNWDDWALVVQRTIEHYSGKADRNMSGVIYEVWNEPDLAQFGSWKMGGDKSYLTLYRYASIGANNAQNTNAFSLGGPSTTGLYKTWIMGLVTSGNRVNFFSWHSYLADPVRFATDQKNLIDWLLPYPRYTLLPKLITEFGFTGAKSKGYSGMYGAAHAAATIRQLISGGPTYLFSFQLKDGPLQSDGSGWGLLTHDDNGLKKKPRYFLYNFIDSMAGTRLSVSGEGTWVTGFSSSKDGVIRLMLVNFDQNGNHTEDVPVTFANLDIGAYKLKTRFLVGREIISDVTINESSFTTTIRMPAQSVVILEIVKSN